MATEKITAEPRNEFGKGAARRIRRADKIPAVLYGHGNEPVHVTLPGHDTMMALKHGGANALLELDINGESQLALTKQVQVDPIHRTLEHIDFVAVRRGEKVTVDVPVHLNGDAASDTLVVTENATVQIEAEATAIPEYIEIDIEGAAVGTQILAKDLTHPERLDAPARSRDPHRQRHGAAERGGPGGRARGGRGRGRHRARGARAGRGRGCDRGARPRRPRLPPRATPLRSDRPTRDQHRGLAGRRAGQPRPDVRRTPTQRGVPRRRRARPTPGRGVPVAQVRTSRRGRGTTRRRWAPTGPASCWPGPAAS